MRKILLALLISFSIACGFTGFSKQVSTWEDHESTSIIDYKIIFIYRVRYKTDEDFYNNVQEQINWLWNHKYIVTDIAYFYGFDITRKEVLRYAVLYYKKEK